MSSTMNDSIFESGSTVTSLSGIFLRFISQCLYYMCVFCCIREPIMLGMENLIALRLTKFELNTESLLLQDGGIELCFDCLDDMILNTFQILQNH